MSPQSTVMAGELGDIFWDLPPWLTYTPGYDIGCSIYVANHSDEEKEYALMARLTRDTTVLSEEALPVFGFTWFKVEPNDFIRLYGALRFAESDCDVTILLIERETEEVTDSVTTRLVAPTTAGTLPPAWPGAPGGTGTDWSSMLMPVMMMGMFGVVMVSALKSEEKKEEVALPIREERKLLPPGRKE
jgi:hypothetical protein